MRQVSLLVTVATVVVTGYVGFLAGAASSQPGGEVDTRRCENAAYDIPEFGGAYLAERVSDGMTVLHVWMTETDSAATDAAVTALRARCPEHAEVVIREARYSYAQLSQWQRLARSVPSVTLAGIDTRTNRLSVGVADLDADGNEVTGALTRRGVPAEALALMEISRPRTLPIVDRSSQVAFTVALGGVAVTAMAVAATVWVRRRRVGRA